MPEPDALMTFDDRFLDPAFLVPPFLDPDFLPADFLVPFAAAFLVPLAAAFLVLFLAAFFVAMFFSFALVKLRTPQKVAWLLQFGNIGLYVANVKAYCVASNNVAQTSSL